MNLRIYLITALIALVLSGFTFFIDYRIALGIILSAGYSLVNMLMLSGSMKVMMSDKESGANYSALIAGNIVRFGLLLVVIYIAVKNPGLFNMYGVAAGFILFMIALIIDALSRRKG